MRRCEVHIVQPLRTLTGPTRPSRLADMGDRIRCRPDGARAGRIVSPGKRRRQDVGNGLMFEARIYVRVFNTGRRRVGIGMNQLDPGRCIGYASRALIRDVHVLGGEDAHAVVGRAGRRGTSKNELKTWALIGLEHDVSESILSRRSEDANQVSNLLPKGYRVLRL